MTTNISPPWATGPGEILRHGIDLLRRDSDVNRRLAMISIDNAVELMIKTYLGLPRRVNGLSIPRREFEDFSQSFPKLLDALETYAIDKLDGINLGEIEWYHRLRNELYHQGNGLTVERDKVEIYSELANLLFNNLFGFRLIEPVDDRTRLLGDFMSAWIELERIISRSPTTTPRNTPLGMLQSLQQAKIISDAEMEELDNLRQIRNSVIHGSNDYHRLITAEIVARINSFADLLAKRLPKATD